MTPHLGCARRHGQKRHENPSNPTRHRHHLPPAHVGRPISKVARPVPEAEGSPMATDRVWRVPSEPLPEEVVRVPRGVVLQDPEGLVPEAPVETRAGLEAEGVEMDVGAAALARPRLDGREQAPPPAVATPVLVDPEEGAVQP